MPIEYRHDDRPEDIRCSAVYWDDGEEYPHQPINIKTGYVVCGLRHHNCLTIHSICGKTTSDTTQGFLTSKNRFVDRKEGVEIALARGQIPERVDILFSEDLY